VPGNKESKVHVPSVSRSECEANDATADAVGGSDKVSRDAECLDFCRFFRGVVPVMIVAEANGNDAFSSDSTSGAAAAAAPDAIAAFITSSTTVAALLLSVSNEVESSLSMSLELCIEGLSLCQPTTPSLCCRVY
jgi:hypothetical protein